MLVKVQGAEQLAQRIYFEYDNESIPLGKGGMGTVYLGRCVSEETGAYTPVAIKFIENNSEDMMRRAMQEASVQIAHPNLMRMWGFIPNMEWDPYSRSQIVRYYVAMEYLEGINLDSILEGTTTSKTGNVVPLAQGFLNKYKEDRVGATIDIMQDILIAMAELHQKGYVHRDIDPSNVMLTASDNIKVIDFGISKCMNAGTDGHIHKLTSYGTIMGKMAYAAPEVVKGYTDMHNFSTDVYSLGIMMYQLAVGELPFIGDSQMVRDAQVNKLVPVENISHWGLSELVRKATEKEQLNRYQNAQEMLDAFEQLKEQGNKPEELPIKSDVSVPTWLWGVVPVVGVVLGIILGLLMF